MNHCSRRFEKLGQPLRRILPRLAARPPIDSDDHASRSRRKRRQVFGETDSGQAQRQRGAFFRVLASLTSPMTRSPIARESAAAYTGNPCTSALTAPSSIDRPPCPPHSRLAPRTRTAAPRTAHRAPAMVAASSESRPRFRSPPTDSAGGDSRRVHAGCCRDSRLTIRPSASGC